MKQTNKTDLLAQAKEYWQVVLHRKWMVLIAGVLLSAAAVIGIELLPKWYSASITVSVDPQRLPDRYVSSTVMTDQLRFDNLSEQVLSSPRLQQIIDELHLYPDLRSSMSEQELVDYMRKNIAVQIKQGGDRNPSAFTIKFIDKNRQVVAKVVTALADSFIQWDLSTRQHLAVGATKFLADQLEAAKTDLNEKQAEVSSFRNQHLGELPEQAGSISATLNRLQLALQANIDNLNRHEQERILFATANAPETTAPVPGERTRLEEQQKRLSEQLADLRSKYSDEYPDVAQTSDRLATVQRQLAQLSGQAISSQHSGSPEAVNSARLQVTNNEISRLHAEQQQILDQIKEYQAKVEAAPLLEQKLAQLGRDYLNASARYQSLVDKSLTAQMGEELERTHEAERFSVLEPAQVPGRAFKPKRLRLIIVALPVSFLLPAFVLVFIEIGLRGIISTEHSLKAMLPGSVPIVGSIPEIETPADISHQRRLASLAIAGSFFCYVALALLLWKLRHSA